MSIKHQLLEMGIEVWRPRRELAEVNTSPDVIIYEFFDSANTPKMCFYLSKDGVKSLKMDDFTANIAKSLQLQCSITDPDTHLITFPKVFAFKLELALLGLDTPNCINLDFSFHEMLNTPNCKRQLWGMISA